MSDMLFVARVFKDIYRGIHYMGIVVGQEPVTYFFESVGTFSAAGSFFLSFSVT